jgi:hypothetical protein
VSDSRKRNEHKIQEDDNFGHHFVKMRKQRDINIEVEDDMSEYEFDDSLKTDIGRFIQKWK